MSKPSEEILFYARCQLEGMLAENEVRKKKWHVQAYGESDFRKLAEDTREAFCNAMQHGAST